MRKATRIIAATFGAFAGFGGLEHGYFEILQGNVQPESIMIASMGAPCVPEEIWHLCEPAMTVIPSFLVTGILAMVLGLVTMIWAAAFVQSRHGGAILTLLSFGLLLFGGGIFPPLIGIIGGVAGTKINRPLKKQHSPAWRMLAKAWPWTIIVFFVFLFGQFVIGYFFNEFVMENGAVLLPALILGLLVVSILAGYGYDIRKHGHIEV
jgi:MFS family permease